jgi:Arc/MetJ-type ribon-helix-helix transcriptional regulator
MIRTQISLTPEQHRQLTKLAKSTGRSMSDLIRSAVDRVYESHRTQEDDIAALRRAFGAWHSQDVDGETYVQRVRSGHRLHTS